MKEKLENFIKDNRSDFDQFEPPAGLWDRIEKQLDERQIGISANKTIKKEAKCLLFYCYPFFTTFAQLSFKVTVRLNTR